MNIRFAHTNIVAEDFRRLASFYESAFRCERLPPERSLSEEWLSRGTGVADAALAGVHLRLPGHGPNGPTLEIFQYENASPRPKPATADRVGFAHIAFEVEDISESVQSVLDHGGALVGEPVTAEIAGAGRLSFVYVADPEGNIIELQRWHR